MPLGKILPAFLFSRATVPDYLLDGVPPGNLGLAHKTVWMTGENFYKLITHFVKHTRPSSQNPILF